MELVLIGRITVSEFNDRWTDDTINNQIIDESGGDSLILQMHKMLEYIEQLEIENVKLKQDISSLENRYRSDGRFS